jgi:hypothetical protein
MFGGKHGPEDPGKPADSAAAWASRPLLSAANMIERNEKKLPKNQPSIERPGQRWRFFFFFFFFSFFESPPWQLVSKCWCFSESWAILGEETAGKGAFQATAKG